MATTRHPDWNDAGPAKNTEIEMRVTLRTHNTLLMKRFIPVRRRMGRARA